MKWFTLLIFTSGCLLFFSGCSLQKEIIQAIPSHQVPREFRAAWVATVANINWPSRPGLPVDSQKTEAIQLLDLLQQHHYNAVIFQVRPQCDALYESPLEPWSYYLTGKQDLGPQPAYDPLHFWIEEAHKRCIELHAWLNPYRAHHPSGGAVTSSSIVHTKPDLVLPLKKGYWWLDPTLPQTQDHTYAVVMDLVKRYDLDGIHFDDYFYPYPAYNDEADFPDTLSWHSYISSGGKMAKGDWRRNAVNSFIERVYKGIKEEKAHVKFGISPFGIWRPGHPASIRGFDQYAALYADAKLWLNEGWVDYFAPQLYWPINQIPQSFPVLLQWWKDQNWKNRHLWPGLSIGRIKGATGRDEVLNQIMVARGMLPQGPGNIHWSIAPIVSSDSLASAISDGPYREKAIAPPMDWLQKKKPNVPTVQYEADIDSLSISWNHPDKTSLQYIVVSKKYGPTWSVDIVPSAQQIIKIPKEVLIKDVKQKITECTISVVDRYGLESPVEQVMINTIPTS